MGEIVMPRLTDSMEEGVILAWLKGDGDEVAVGDELVEIETDKASMVYESDLAGTLSILVAEGETRPIGEPIATVGVDSSGESGEAGSARSSKEAPSAGTDVPEASPSETEPESEPASRIKVSPLARRIARDQGVELNRLTGSGPGGRIIKADVEDAAASRASTSVGTAKGGPEIVELNRTQQVIARRMSESKANIPHFYLRTEIDMDRAMAVRRAFKAQTPEGQPAPSLNDLVVKAVAIALRQHPKANGAFVDGHFELYPEVNVGIAVATEGALIVPVIKDADRKNLTQIGQESRRLAEDVRSGAITPPDLAGGTFTVSNLGMFGVTGFDAVINPGQAGILAVGEISERPVIREGEFDSAHLMEVTLACDHRILYGAEGAEFLATVKANLQEPGLLA